MAAGLQQLRRARRGLEPPPAHRQPDVRARKANMTGVIYAHSSTRLAEISDGTSNTILFGEHLSTASFDAQTQPTYHPWNSGFWTDTMVNGYYPINASHKLLNFGDATSRDYIAMSLASNHPGGQRRVLRRQRPVPQGHDRLLADRPGHQGGPRRAVQLRRDRAHLHQPRREGRRAPEALDPESRRYSQR
ncbi:MAG: DUF1559 domain-containing protein [Isosphaeraceae bacterium]